LIFNKARQTAPCYLVFEDLDSLVSDSVRSFFLNQVDGIAKNDGILMVGSTNHLDKLDPGISKRPSRFDRKYFFPDPDFDQRVKYCEFWRRKVLGADADVMPQRDDKIEFPKSLCTAAAKITDGFSFAYIQEAFLASLLMIATEAPAVETDPDFEFDLLDDAADSGSDAEGEDDDLEKVILWQEFQKQVKILREDMDSSAEPSVNRGMSALKISR
jgi:transitional endoplasmic reticulum ATPase